MYPTNLSFICEGEIKRLLWQTNLKEFIATKPAVEKIHKGNSVHRSSRQMHPEE
jgi:hypothetical protein